MHRHFIPMAEYNNTNGGFIFKTDQIIIDFMIKDGDKEAVWF